MRDKLLLPLIAFLLRALSPVGRVEALFVVNRLVDQDLEAETENPAVGAAGETEERCVQGAVYHR